MIQEVLFLVWKEIILNLEFKFTYFVNEWMNEREWLYVIMNNTEFYISF